MAQKQLLLAVTSLLLSAGANAAVIATDFATAGDGLITRDVDNNLEWLDVAATVGMSADEAAALYAGDGFRPATTDEVIALYISAGIDEILDFSTFPPVTVHGTYNFEDTFSPYNVSSAEGQAAVANLMELLGFTPDGFGGTDWVSGYLADEDLDGFRDLARLQMATSFQDAAAHTNSSGDFFEPDMASEFHGSWLVRDSVAVVPIPGAVWLLGSGLIGLMGFGRKRH